MQFDDESRSFFLSPEEQTLIGATTDQAVWHMNEVHQLVELTQAAQTKLDMSQIAEYGLLGQRHELQARPYRSSRRLLK